MTAWSKPLPHPTHISQPFWDALKEHKIKIQYCPDSEQWIFFPRLHCPTSGSRNLEWREISGEGTLYTWTNARIPTMPEFTDEMPQRLAVIKLDEGPHINTNLVGVEDEDLKIGMRMRPVFDDRPGEATILRYTSAESEHPGVIAADQPEAQAAADAKKDEADEKPKRKVSCRDIDGMKSLITEEFTPWSNAITVTQELIDGFAEMTGDDYWIHTDPEKCKQMSPFGQPIAQGFLTLVLMPKMRIPSDYEVTDFTNMVNYGTTRLRFLAPVPVNCKLHARNRVIDVQEVKAGTQVTLEVNINVVGQEKPSVIYDLIMIYM